MSAQYEKPAVLLDLEARQEEGYVPSSVLTQGTDPEPSKDGFVGVDPVYRNFANETDKPYVADADSPEGKVAADAYAEDVDTDAGATPEAPEAVYEDDTEEDEESASTPPPAGQTPSY